MITLISGALGTGKTALAVKLLTENSAYPNNAVIVGVREWCGGGSFHPLKSQQNAIENQRMIEEIGGLSGTVYLIDEGKKIWPSRIAGKPAPEFIDSHLAESRSIAQDWIITCQAPTQIDVALRRLVGRHIHLERVPFGIKYSESGQVVDDLKFSRDESRKYSFPTESLKLYKSDDGVTDLQKKGLHTPKRIIMLLMLIAVLISVIGYFTSQSKIFQQAIGTYENDNPNPTPTKPDSVINNATTTNQTPKPPDGVLYLTQADDIFAFKPKNPDYPEIAKAPRIPISCLENKTNGCICYDQYNQRIHDFPLKRCQDIIGGTDQIAFTRNPFYNK